MNNPQVISHVLTGLLGFSVSATLIVQIYRCSKR